jgi:hypothetical protein
MQYGSSPLSVLADDVVDDLLQCRETPMARLEPAAMSAFAPLLETQQTSKRCPDLRVSICEYTSLGADADLSRPRSSRPMIGVGVVLSGVKSFG